MTGAGSSPRNADQQYRDWNKRLVSLERRSLRASLSNSGQEVTDWHQASAPGFYWGSGAANQPTGVTAWGEALGSAWVGTVSVYPTGGRLVVEVHEVDPTRAAISYFSYFDGTIWTAWVADDPRDSGWVDLSSYLLSGFTGSLLGNRLGKRVEIRGSITGTFPTGTAATDFTSALPALWRPSGTLNVWDSGYSSGTPVSVGLRPAGTMTVANRVPIAATALQFTMRYRLG